MAPRLPIGSLIRSRGRGFHAASGAVDQCTFPELGCGCANAVDDCLDCEDSVFPLLDQMGLTNCVDGCP